MRPFGNSFEEPRFAITADILQVADTIANLEGLRTRRSGVLL